MHIHTEKRERRHILSPSARFWHMARIVVDSSLASYLALSSWTQQLFRFSLQALGDERSAHL